MNRLASLLLIAETLYFGSIRAAEQRVQDFVLRRSHGLYRAGFCVARDDDLLSVAHRRHRRRAHDRRRQNARRVPNRPHQRHRLFFRAGAGERRDDESQRSLEQPHYVFELRESAEPCYSLILRGGGEKTSGAARPLTPNRLLGILDKVKAFPLLQQYQPEVVRDVEYRDFRAKPLVSDCGDYEVRLIGSVPLPGAGHARLPTERLEQNRQTSGACAGAA